MNSVTNKGHMPETPHWAIVTYGSVYHAGDERSRTHPGHGYPAYSEEVVKYQAFDDEDDWKETVREYTAQRTTFNAMRVIPATISTEISISVDSEE